jgi:carbon monoxide dehydrogenase subunit G
MLVKILIGLVIVIVIFVVVVSLRPSEFRVARSATISAPPAAVFEQVNDLQKWKVWSPWEKMDPAMKQIYEGPQSGTGASSSWVGNNQVGEGKMTITDSRPNESVKFKLEFLKPFAATNTAEFTFKPEGEQTVVTWSMTGRNNFMFKAVGLFMDCDKMVGGNFEQGLASMKSAVEGAPKP